MSVSASLRLSAFAVSPGRPVALPRRMRASSLRAFSIVISLGIAAGVCAPAWSQGVTFVGGQTNLGSGLHFPQGVAIDASGDVFVADAQNNAVKEILAVNGVVPANPAIRTLGSGFSDPTGVAVDASGDVFVADYNHNAIKEIVALNGSIPLSPTINTLGSGFSNPSGVAVDASGDVFVADYANNEVKEILAVNGSIPSNNPTINTLSSGFNAPFSVAVDSSGDVFVADTYDSAIKELVAVNGSIPANNPTINTLGSGFLLPFGVAVDASGDVFVADTYHSAVKEMFAVNGVIPANPTIHTLGSTGVPFGVAVDTRGDVFVGDGTKTSIVEIQTQAVNFGSANVCPAGQNSPAPCSNNQTLTYNIAAGTTVQSIGILTQGAANLDYQAEANDSSPYLCTAQTYLAATTCTVDVTFAPLAPGARNGAVEMVDGSGNILVNTYAYGTGVGPVITYGPSAETTLGSGFQAPAGVAVDAGGNVFVADTDANVVSEILAHNGTIPAHPIINTLATGFNEPAGVAVDGSGDVFVADFGNRAVKEIVAVNGSIPVNPAILTLGSGFNYLSGVAVDGSGNVFVADTLNDAVKEIVAVNGSIPANPTILTLGSGFNYPGDVAVDGSGDVFVADEGDNAVKEILAVNGVIPANPTINALGSGFNTPLGVAVDSAGDVFVADDDNNVVKELLAVNGSIPANPTINTFGGFTFPNTVALDAAGNVIVADYGDGVVKEVQRSQPPSLSFAMTPVYSTSTDSPQTVTLQNVGNAPLNFPIPQSGNNPSIANNFSLDASTTCPEVSSSSSAPGTLAEGQECGLAIDFTPQQLGHFGGSVVLTDNALNGNPATQSIRLTGDSTPATPAITFSVPNQVYGTAPFRLNATSDSSGSISYSVISGPATIMGNTVTINGAGQVTLQASQEAHGNYASGTQNATFTVSPAVLTVMPVPQNNAPTITVGYGNAMPTLSFFYGISGFVNGDTVAVVSGQPALSVGFGSSAPPVGSYPFNIGVGTLSAANYTFVTQNGTIYVVPASIVVKPNSTVTKYGTAPTLSYVVTGLKYGQTSSVFSTMPTVTTTATTRSSIGNYPISVNINGITAPNYTLVAGSNATLTVNPVNLQVKALSTSKTYGAALPTLNYAYSGFVNGDNSSVVSGTPTISTTATASSPAGTYPISAAVSGLSATNYTFSSGPNAVLTVYPAVLTVAAQPVTITHGSAIPTLTYKVTGFVNGDPSSVVSGSPNLTTTAMQGSPDGNYPINITMGTLAATNYTFKLTNSTLTIH